MARQKATVKHVAGLVRTLREHVQFFARVEVPAKQSRLGLWNTRGPMLSPISVGRDGLTLYNSLDG